MKKSKTSLFLMELMISILLFSVTSAVCLLLFVNTHLRTQDTKDLQYAITEAQNVHALIRSSAFDSLEELSVILKDLYPALSQEDCLINSFDGKEQLTLQYSADCHMTLTAQLDEKLLFVTLRFTASSATEKEIYTFRFEKYIPNGRCLDA